MRSKPRDSELVSNLIHYISQQLYTPTRKTLLDEEVRLQVEVEARGAQQHALHVVRAQPEGRVLAG